MIMEELKLEPNYASTFNAWKAKPGKQTMGNLIRQIQPDIDKGVMANVGKNPSPNIRSSARKAAIGAVRTYNPVKSKLSTHVINHMKGLRRTNRKQQQILHVPERVSLDQSFLARAEAELDDRLGREPTTSELADHTGLSRRRITKVRGYRMPVAEGSLLSMQHGGEHTSFQPSVEHDQEDILVRAVYDDLDEVNQKILEWTLGMYGRKALTNQEIASKLRMTPGGVSQRKAIIQGQMDQMEQLGVF